jgi:sialic acid synthase SpsE
MKCTSAYPAEPVSSNLKTIENLKETFGVLVGLSDHTHGIGAAIAGVALGAVAVEKHFTLRRADGGFDSSFSLEPAELKALVNESKTAWASVGKVEYGRSQKEQESIQFRRSIYVVKDVQAGEPFTRENIRVIRPGYGLEPKYLPVVLEKKAARSALRGTRLSWDLIG